MYAYARLGIGSFALTLCVSAAAGCAHYSGVPLEAEEQASSVLPQREALGLFVAARPLTSSENSEKYFARDLVGQGYAPVLLLFELDDGANGSFDIRREDLRLCLRDGTRLEAARAQDVADNVRFSHVRSMFGFLFILPGFFVASSVNGANAELEDDYGSKSLESIRVNRNSRSFNGVVFFRIPETLQDTFSIDEAFVETKVYMSGGESGVGRVLEFPVHFDS